MINVWRVLIRAGRFFPRLSYRSMAYPRSLSVLAGGVLALAFAGAAPALAEGASTDAAAHTDVSERGGIQTTGQVIFQDIAVMPNVTIAPSIDSTSNSQITVLGQGGDAVSLGVPEAIDMTNASGEQTLTVVTNADGSYAVPMLQGTLSSDGVLSVNVGGTIQVASGQLQPGEYRGVLVVVANYN
jgi:hypothetical protein